MDVDIDLLSVGRRNYGDALLCRANGRSMLVDGAHPGDEDLVARQLRRIMPKEGEVNVDLVVISHAHEDHIGCLPEMIQRGDIRADWALVPAISLAWPPDGTALSDNETGLLAAAREEDFSFLSDKELENALESARTVKDRYQEMVQTMEAGGCHLFQYTGQNISELLEEFSDIRLRLLGPDANLLNLAAEGMATSLATIGAALRRLETPAHSVAAASPVDLYRHITNTARGSFAQFEDLSSDRAVLEAVRRAGAAVNAQSLVLSVGERGSKILLTGDMQFGDPEVSEELSDAVRALWDEVVRNGPYGFTKLSHHGSHDGFPTNLPYDLGCRNFGISTGTDSKKHPSCEVVESLAGDAKNRWVRTDRNGHSTVSIQQRVATLIPEMGKINDTKCEMIR